MTNYIEQYTAARRVSVPVVVIRTVDQPAALADIVQAESAGKQPFAVLTWDAVRGLAGANKSGEQAMVTAKVNGEDTVGFPEAMVAARLLPPRTVVVALNANRQLTAMEPLAVATSVQAVANLRDDFKKSFRMLVMLGPAFSLPVELEQDVILLDHALPEPDELREVVASMHTSASLKAPDGEVMVRAVDAISGLSRFAAEQVTAMSLRKEGLDLDGLWERKRLTIEQTPGLSVWRGGDTFADLVGLDSIKAHLKMRTKARTPVGVGVFIDEIDKVLANVESDTSGVRVDQVRTMLTEMEDNGWPGLIAVGVAGGGKSAIAKAFGNEAGVPTVSLDLGGMENKYVGESEAQLRHAIKVIKAIGRGHAYFIATSNGMSVMRPELQRRFTDGLWFFDLMTAEERAATWKAYMKKYELAKQALPDDEAWTGAEIRNCCRYAWDTGCTLVEASRMIVPMARSRADEVERLRRSAHGRFLDASRPGPYSYDPKPMADQARAIELPVGIATLDTSGIGKMN